MVTKKTIRTTIKLRRATEAEWEEINPILDLAEPGYAYDVQGLKIGNGIDHWNDLEYINKAFENITIDCGTSIIGV